MISVIGKGSYGKVVLVKKKDNGKMYALKVLKKAEIVKRNQVEHTMAERRILVSFLKLIKVLVIILTFLFIPFFNLIGKYPSSICS